uniref:Neurotransmitter-gated ion-channel transmembrane domain-containing protein n=1 Tax=Caenorhabditis japonica TaxID=281687 RepID=A0A8R1I8R3_CAEJA
MSVTFLKQLIFPSSDPSGALFSPQPVNDFLIKNGGGERGQLRQAGRRKAPPPPAVALPHAEPGPLMLSASAISAFSMTGDSTILESKLKRRYALEWEYLASVLDRVLLIVFSLVVFFVTSIMILVGEAMHLSYELAAKEL